MELIIHFNALPQPVLCLVVFMLTFKQKYRYYMQINLYYLISFEC